MQGHCCYICLYIRFLFSGQSVNVFLSSLVPTFCHRVNKSVVGQSGTVKPKSEAIGRIGAKTFSLCHMLNAKDLLYLVLFISPPLFLTGSSSRTRRQWILCVVSVRSWSCVDKNVFLKTKQNIKRYSMKRQNVLMDSSHFIQHF